jgi:hypothetical protein
MPAIEILSLPPGAAPEEVRASWVGLKLEIAHGIDAPQTYKVSSIHTRFDGWLRKLAIRLRIFRPSMEKIIGYPVEVMPAIWSLEQAGQIAAAMWWCKNVPHLLKPGQVIIFPNSCCQLAQGESGGA